MKVFAAARFALAKANDYVYGELLRMFGQEIIALAEEGVIRTRHARH